MPFGFFEDDESGVGNILTANILGLAVSAPPTLYYNKQFSRKLDSLPDSDLIQINPNFSLSAPTEHVKPGTIRGALGAEATVNPRYNVADTPELKSLKDIMGVDVGFQEAPHREYNYIPPLSKPLQGKDYRPVGIVGIGFNKSRANPAPNTEGLDPDRAALIEEMARSKARATASKAAIIHELGHATAFAPESSIGRRILTHSYMPTRLAILSGFGPVAMMAMDPNKGSDVALALGFQSLLEAPVLLDEFIANKKAFKAMDDLKALGRMTSSSVDIGKDLLRTGYKSYASGAAGRLLGSAMAIGLANDEIRSKINPFD
jgi:hypothetical protein